jgi:hypothetical protein
LPLTPFENPETIFIDLTKEEWYLLLKYSKAFVYSLTFANFK